MLAQHMAKANKELKAGMEVRIPAIPADASKVLGMCDALNGFDDAAALSNALKARVANTTAHRSPPFSQRCVSPTNAMRGPPSCAARWKALSPNRYPRRPADKLTVPPLQVAAAHLPFLGIGHLRKEEKG
ncbi:Uncharacterized protein ALO43_00446 [Pseudomonas tremae]|uniref:Uncharacterized protein n=1 Tax=Pseudomonas tremae TaxID=200454 RepID=A0AA40P2P5_9PSED|nr:Uncharacterized protein ALO43_00446 [Pseudomonas tremae]KPZ29482.1 Uncharacterized protein ALO38_03307 [Pseudomonas coronafaciens pv. zizaniae]RMO06994.1 hypothetical protein ALQ48_03223 [Pseudomonas coronafaciens pv. zizaniae]